MPNTSLQVAGAALELPRPPPVLWLILATWCRKGTLHVIGDAMRTARFLSIAFYFAQVAEVAGLNTIQSLASGYILDWWRVSNADSVPFGELLKSPSWLQQY
jgi:hypothetical protein